MSILHYRKKEIERRKEEERLTVSKSLNQSSVEEETLFSFHRILFDDSS
jgi:hypothetical protein